MCFPDVAFHLRFGVFYFSLGREQHTCRSVTNKISCMYSEDIYQHLPSLISVINVHIIEDKIQSFPLSLCRAPSPGDDMVTLLVILVKRKLTSKK